MTRSRMICRAILVTAAAGVLPIVVGGCRRDDPARESAYREATAVLRREEAALANIRRDIELLRGEYLMHDGEGRLLVVGPSAAGESETLRRAVSFSLADRLGIWWSRPSATAETQRPLRRLVATVATLGRLIEGPPIGLEQLADFLHRHATALRLKDPVRGRLMRRQAETNFAARLTQLERKAAEQAEQVRRAADYAKLLAPQ